MPKKNPQLHTGSDKESPKPHANAMWGGRFAQGASEVMDAVNVSIDVDKRLYTQDIAGSLAHCEMLAKTGILDKTEAARIRQGLIEINAEIASGDFQFDRMLEDIHMNIEHALSGKIGETAGRLHTARSRNDQVATDFRLYLREAIDEIDALYRALLEVLLTQAQAGAALAMPGFTHLQPAQPVTFGHHLTAYVEMFFRDLDRLQDCRKRVNESPLGAAALAGTSFPIDREMTAKILGFARPMRNSMDAVSARDFALEFLSVSAIAAIHLSRLAEELVLWVSPQFGFVQLPESFTSGSSIMPQKKNPDAAELVRAKSGRILGGLVTLAQVMKALPLTYSKDMQEDKPPVFDAVDSWQLMLKALSGMVEGLKPCPDKMRAALQDGCLLATDMADWLVRELNLPFRTAHHITGAAVAEAERRGVGLEALDLQTLQTLHPEITDRIYPCLNTDQALNSRNSFGGTAPDNVRAAIDEACARLRKMKSRT